MALGIGSINEVDFAEVYRNYYPRMLRFACAYLKSEQDAENIVQDIFAYLWEHRSILFEARTLQAFLFTLVKRRCIDFLRRKVNSTAPINSFQYIENRELEFKLYALEAFDEDTLADADMERMLFEAINRLPEKCRYIFVQSKLKHRKHQDIALETGLSVQTIKNQIAIAIRKLQAELKNTLPLLLLLAESVK